MNIKFNEKHLSIEIENNYLTIVKLFFIQYEKYFGDLEKLRIKYIRTNNSSKRKILNDKRLIVVKKTISDLTVDGI